MREIKMSLHGKNFKRQVVSLLKSSDFEKALEEMCELSLKRLINPLVSCLSREDLKWNAIKAMGIVVSGIADENMEDARIVMRKLMWNLTEECGGIGWGIPEAMGEIMACNERLANEYTKILVSYINENGNFLEYEPLQQGALWGIRRLAEVRPELLKECDAHKYLCNFLDSNDNIIKELAAESLKMIEGSL